MRRLLLAFGMLAASAVSAQQATTASGAVLRALDKTSGNTVDITVPSGQGARIGRMQVVVKECRYPAGNPSGDAFVALEVSEVGQAGTVFSGWMIASAPALNAMEHPRYDIWVMRCTTS
ncbi:DUF2155 domain-containing protein [Sulfitobacter sp. S190]|uniref:DUF2155 domain-containing protein n=1 Tax=Sulfitobacter sp. S190 TaxID=2867022 RepID=UPI0021A466BA|nr:DUF2155 domain-containing protein [Sulfitobacter sp. S190]UWR21085.1 DUF2155 domain-containing protein [Sulfitobacter sp. S190]